MNRLNIYRKSSKICIDMLNESNIRIWSSEFTISAFIFTIMTQQFISFRRTMWLLSKFGVILIVLHFSCAAEEFFESDSFDLRQVIPGEPGIDYPIYGVAPRTSFSCIGRHEGDLA